MIKTWEIAGNGIPYGVHPDDELNVFHTEGLVSNILAKEVNWNDATIISFELVKYKLSRGEPLPPAYQVPIGFIWSGVGTYHEARRNGSTDEGLSRAGFLTKIPVPSAVPESKPNMVLDSKESLNRAPVNMIQAQQQPESPLREDLDPQSRYYDAGGIETIDVIKAKLTPEQLRGYLLGNLIKYSCRMNFKGSAVRDAEKCKYYAQWLAELEQENV